MKIYELSTTYGTEGVEQKKLYYKDFDKCEEVFNDKFLTLRSSLVLQNGDSSIKEYRDEDCDYPLVRSLILHHITRDKKNDFVCLQIREYNTED